MKTFTIKRKRQYDLVFTATTRGQITFRLMDGGEQFGLIEYILTDMCEGVINKKAYILASVRHLKLTPSQENKLCEWFAANDRNLKGKAFPSEFDKENTITVLHYHHGGYWVVQEKKKGTTWAMHEDEILKHLL